DAYSVVKVPLLAAIARRAGPRGIEPRPRRFWRPAGHHDLDPSMPRRKVRPRAVGFPLVPAHRWPTTGLGLPAAGGFGSPGELLIAPRTRAGRGIDARDGAQQGMAPEHCVGGLIPHHRQPMVPIFWAASTAFSGLLDDQICR